VLYQVSEDGIFAVVTFGGELDLGNGRALKEKIESLSDQIKIVILDLKDVTYINSSGIGQLVSVLKMCTLRECRLKLANLSANVAQILTITKLDRVLSIYPSIEAAKTEL
jgi:anti-sigma B factor antagonist